MNKQTDANNTSTQALSNAEKEMQTWYDEQFLPYKEQKQQEKTDFQEFKKIILSNTTEVKYLLSNIFDANYEKSVATWNELNFEPKAQKIELVDDMLIVTEQSNKELKVNFDKLLLDISKILGE